MWPGTYDVGNTQDGEWLKYVVYSPTAKTYNVALKVATTFGTAHVRYDLDSIGNTVGASTAIPNTGAFQTFGTANTSVAMTAGYHALYVYVVNGGFNIDSMTLT